MQFKKLFLFFPFLFFSGIASAQYWKENLPANRAKAAAVNVQKEKDKSDSVKAQYLFCKEEEQRSIVAIALAASRDQRNKAMVPLAGQKSYFGDKNEYTMDFVRQYIESHKKTLAVVNTRSKSQFSMMDNVLKKNNLPNQLKYLAVIESALNNNAVSPVGAVGPWQFMTETARMMGLTVNGSRDDRKDWFKSTTAAAKYLNYLYNEMEDWLLVIASYNCGPTPVKRAMAKTGSNNFWDIKPYLPRETQGHVMAFIATASIFENMKKFIATGTIPEDFVMHPEMAPAKGEAKNPAKPKIVFTPEEIKNMAIITLSEPLSIEVLELELGIDKQLLHKWNPDYELFVLDLYPEKEYRFRMPKDKIDGYVEKRSLISKKSEKYFKDLLM
ncbi:MAG: lytic transglycosylase domain-containing protein [Chitinophagaceae bacterium]|nr:lytic transglycosylase domain-containing protein [Chitinophagaceae bacterium]